MSPRFFYTVKSLHDAFDWGLATWQMWRFHRVALVRYDITLALSHPTHWALLWFSGPNWRDNLCEFYGGMGK